MVDSSRWRLLRTGEGPPAWNLALDEALLLEPADARPVLRLYGWDPPALSLGHFQPLGPFERPAAEAGLTIVRRPTGGGAIHHVDELTFSIVARPGRDGYPADTVEAYRIVHAVVADALADVGAEVRTRGDDVPLSVAPGSATLCFHDTTALDLVVPARGGAKLVGSAQRRVGDRVLHHGSIPLAVPPLTPEAASVEQAAGRRVDWDELADALVARAAVRFGAFDADEPSDGERAAARRLVAERYGHVTPTRRERR